MPTYTVKKGQQQEDVLQIDGKQSVCPFSAPIPFQGNMGQIQIMRMPCSTLCPLAQYQDGKYYLDCGSQQLVHTATQEEDKPKSPLSVL